MGSLFYFCCRRLSRALFAQGAKSSFLGEQTGNFSSLLIPGFAMKARLSFLGVYFLFWVVLFTLGRAFFLITTRDAGLLAGFNEWGGVFRHGILMDISTATYFTLPVLILILAGVWLPVLNKKQVFVIYSILLLIPVLLIFVSDGYSFDAWGHRLEAGALRYLNNPGEAWASVSNLPVIRIFLLMALVLAGVIYLTIKGIRKFIPFPKSNRWMMSLICIILAGLAIIPLRGGLQLAPINQSSVYFSGNNYANQAALNPVWNFIHSIRLERESDNNPFVFMDMAQAGRVVDSLFSKQTLPLTDSANRKNVILVVWESFTAKVLDKKYHGVEITPWFNQLKNEGLYFNNIYATGDRTDKGIVGVLSGYPAQPINSIVKFPNKTRSLPMLTSVLGNRGYFTGFYYGGEPEFANIKSYLMHGRMDKMIDVHSFSEADRNSKWGAHDGVVMNYLLNEIPKLPQPFFITWLTLSSHEPYETPVPTAIEGKDDVSLFLNSLHYTDQVLHDFVEGCRKLPSWNNTLLMVVADHGHRFPPDTLISNNFRIPLLVLGAEVKPQTVTQVGSQIDLPATLLGKLGDSTSVFPYSMNMLSPHYNPWAWYAFYNGFGYVTPTGTVVFDNVGKRPILKLGNADTAMLNDGRALQQVFYEDFLQRDRIPVPNAN